MSADRLNRLALMFIHREMSGDEIKDLLTENT